MIVKERDATPQVIEMLERRAAYAGDVVLKGACRSAAARLRADGTTARACAFIDANFADTDEWAVIHDLRLCVDAHAVQMNHVLISDTLEVVAVDTRFIDCGLHVEAEGRCESVDGETRRLVASPLAKLSRDLRVLGTELARVGLPRRRLGFGPRPALRGCVLVDPAYRLGATMGDEDDAIGLFPREALYRMLWKRRRRRRHPTFERISGEALEALATSLAERHQPTFPASLLGDDITRVNDGTLRLLAAHRRTVDGSGRRAVA